MKHSPLRLLFLLIVLLAAFRAALGCGYPPSVVQKYNWSKNIVSLKLVSLEDAPPGGTDVHYTGIAVLRVERVFKGDLQPGRELAFNNLDENSYRCGAYRFSKELSDKEMLLYLPDAPTHEGRWEASSEMMGSLQPGSIDMFYLETALKYRNKSLFFGTLSNSEYPAPGDPLFRRHPVTITGNGKTYKTRTDKNGIYKVSDVPPGRYEINAGKVPGFKMVGLPASCEIKAGEHFQKNVGMTIDNTISGRVADARGAVLDQISVYLVRANLAPPPDLARSESTDPFGAFTFSGVSAGRYVLAVNYSEAPTPEEPFRTFYYPGTFKREEALEITVAPGTELRNIDLTSPEILDVINIRGTLMNDAGEPVPDGLIWFFEDRGTPGSGPPPPEQGLGKQTLLAKADANGQFVFTLAKGRKGWIRSSYPVWKDSQKECPKMLAKFDELGAVNLNAFSADVRFEGDRDVSGIELKLQYPVCKRTVLPFTFRTLERPRQ